MYRGMRTAVDSRDGVTNISSLAGDADLHLRASTGNFVWRGRASGGYLSDQSSRGNSSARISKLYLGVTHEPTGAELVLGRQRLSENGVYGYFDGARLSYPLMRGLAVNMVGGTTTDSSRESPDTARKVYGLGAEYEVPELPLRLQFYGIEQTFEGLTERRAVGGEASYFDDHSHYLLVVDYDVKFKEANNLMFNGSWDLNADTNVALSLGYQRSPFLTASNAIIGEFRLSLGQFVETLANASDVYDVALAKTAVSRYASLVVNRRLSDNHRLIGELYRFELTDIPQFDPAFDAPSSDANTTAGLQYIWQNAFTSSDALSLGGRYTGGDVSNAASIYLNEKLHLGTHLDMTLRLLGSRRWRNDISQETWTVRPGLRLDWYFTRDFLLDMEMGYEWSNQDFGNGSLQIQQGFVLMGLRKRI